MKIPNGPEEAKKWVEQARSLKEQLDSHVALVARQSERIRELEAAIQL